MKKKNKNRLLKVLNIVILSVFLLQPTGGPGVYFAFASSDDNAEPVVTQEDADESVEDESEEVNDEENSESSDARQDEDTDTDENTEDADTVDENTEEEVVPTDTESTDAEGYGETRQGTDEEEDEGSEEDSTPTSEESQNNAVQSDTESTDAEGYGETKQDTDKKTCVDEWEEKDGAYTRCVEEGIKYELDINEEDNLGALKITFTNIDEEENKDNDREITIKEVELTDEQIVELGALSNTAYDITSTMENGSFEYDLVLPLPENVDVEKENISVVYVEDEKALKDLTDKDTVKDATVDKDVKIKVDTKAETVETKNLNHMTIFVVVMPNPVATNCSNASVGIVGTDTCYNTLQDAIDNAVAGDEIEITADLNITESVHVNKSVSIKGNSHSLLPVFNKTTNSNNSALAIDVDDVEIYDLIIKGSGGTNLHGINIYESANVLLNNVIVENNDYTGVVVNGSEVEVMDLTTQGNGWHGVNVDKGGGVTNSAILKVTGQSVHNEGILVADIYVDDTTKDVTVTDTNNQYNFLDSVKVSNDRVYKLKPDTTPPSMDNFNIFIQDDAGIYVSSDFVTNGDMVRVEVDATDDNSGVKDVEFRIQKTTGGDYVTSREWIDTSISGNTYRFEFQIPTDGKYINTHDLMTEDVDGHTAWARATDNVGNYNHGISDTFTYDKTAPSIPVLTSPIGMINDNAPLMQWEDSTDDNGVAGYYYRVYYNCSDENNVPASCSSLYPDETGVWRTTSEYQAGPTHDGIYFWQVMAEDNTGNQSAWSGLEKVVIDATAPATPTGLQRLLATDHSKVFPCGAVSVIQSMHPDWDDNDEDDFNHYEYTSFNAPSGNVGTKKVFTDSIFEYTGSWLPGEGTYGFAVRAVDHVGNKSAWALGGTETFADSCQITYDATAPDAPTLVFPDDGAVENGGPTQVWSHSNLSDVHQYLYESYSDEGLNNLVYDTTVTGTSRTIGGAQNTVIWWRVAAVDAAGNVSEWSDAWKLTIDNISPTITDLSVNPQNVKAGDEITIRAKVTDDSGIAAVSADFSYDASYGDRPTPTSVSMNSVDNDYYEVLYTVPATWQEGAVYVKVAARDNTGGNWTRGDEHKIVLVDNTAPTLILDLPLDGAVLAGTINLEATCDEECDYVNFWWREELQSYSNTSPDRRYHYEYTNGTTFTWELDSLNAERWGTDPSYTMADGTYYFYAATKDVVGNWAKSAEVMVIVDNTAPEGTIDYVELKNLNHNPVSIYQDTSWVHQENKPNVVGTATDNNSVALVMLVVNGQEYTATINGNDWEVDVTDFIPDGLYDMTVTITDVAGNTVVVVQSIRIDTVVPTVEYKQFDGDTEVTGTVAYVNDLSRLSFTADYSDVGPTAGLYQDSYVIFHAGDDGSFGFGHNSTKYPNGFCSWRSNPNLVHMTGIAGEGTNTWSLPFTEKESFTNCTVTLPDGEYYMAHQVYDGATRKDIPSINHFRDVLGLHFIVDTVAPTIDIIAPTDMEIVISPFTVEANVVDDKMLEKTSVKLFNKAGEEQGGLCTISKTDENEVGQSDFDPAGVDVISALPLGDTQTITCDFKSDYPSGEYYVKVKTIDKAGNTHYETRNFIIDNTAPTVNKLENQIFQEGDAVPTIEIVGQDNIDIEQLCITVTGPVGTFLPVAPATRCESSGSGTSYTWTNPVGFPANFDTSMIPEGEYAMNYYAVDSAGHESQENTVTYILENVAPQVIFTASDTDIDENEDKIVFTASFNDPSTVDAGDNLFDDSKWTASIDYGDHNDVVELGTFTDDGDIEIPDHEYNKDGDLTTTLTVCESQEKVSSEKECTSVSIPMEVDDVKTGGSSSNKKKTPVTVASAPIYYADSTIQSDTENVGETQEGNQDEEKQENENSDKDQSQDTAGGTVDDGSEGQVKGAETCRSWPFWAWFVMILSYTGIAYIIGRRAKNVSDSKRNLLWQGLILLGAVGLWYFFDTCRTYTWVPIVASIVGVVLVLVLFNRTSSNTPPTQTPPNTTSGGPRVT